VKIWAKEGISLMCFTALLIVHWGNRVCCMAPTSY